MPPGGPAEGFRQTRAAHRSETAEDYVELIADLIDARGEARAVDIAVRLGITQATVANTVSRLQRDGLIEHRPYRSIFLTEAGRELAEMARRRHRLVVAFLRALGAFGGDGRAGRRGDRAPRQRRDPQGLRPLRRSERRLVSQGQSVPISRATLSCLSSRHVLAAHGLGKPATNGLLTEARRE